jgi:hypothetical protein
MSDEKIIYIVIWVATFLTIGFVLNYYNRSDFKEVCDKSGGVTVWDGRQYQCIRTTPATIQSK